MFATAVSSGEVLTEIHVPVVAPGTGVRLREVRASGVTLRGRRRGRGRHDGERGVHGAACRSHRRNGAAPRVSPTLEAALTNSALEDAGVAAACRGAIAADGLLGDSYASAEYRAHLVTVLARRAIGRAAARARA